MYCCEPQELVSEWKRRTCLRNHILIPSMFGVLRFSEWGRLQQLSRNFEDDIRTPCRPRDSQYVNVRQQNLQWIWRRKNKHEDVFVGTSSCAELCVGCISFHLYKRRAIFTGGLGALEKRVSQRYHLVAPPGWKISTPSEGPRVGPCLGPKSGEPLFQRPDRCLRKQGLGLRVPRGGGGWVFPVGGVRGRMRGFWTLYLAEKFGWVK